MQKVWDVTRRRNKHNKDLCFFWCNWGKDWCDLYLETFQNTISNVILDEIKMDFGLNFHPKCDSWCSLMKFHELHP
jgi:hypothetical protein